ESRLRQQVLPVEQEAGVHVPRNPEHGVTQDVGRPDALEVVVRGDTRCALDQGVEWDDGIERDVFWYPGVAELGDVGGNVTDVGGEQLLMRRGPRDLLYVHVHPGMLGLELRHHLLGDLALAPHPPEVDDDVGRGWAAAAGAEDDERAHLYPG